VRRVPGGRTVRMSPGIAAVIIGLLTACSSPANHGPFRAVPLPASFVCNQPMPAARPGGLTLTGVGYGPYHSGQNPNFGISPSGEEVAADMATLSSMTNYIRVYSSTGPAAEIVRAAQAAHICVALGISLGRDAAVNATEIAAGVLLARRYRAVRSVIVGNEVLLRGDLTVGQLRADIRKVRAALGHTVAISTADDFNQWLAHPELAEDVDFATVHIYPFWGNAAIGSAIQTLSDDYARVRRRLPGKPIVIGETGWPSGIDIPASGPGRAPPLAMAQGTASPSPENQAAYFKGFVIWARQHNIPYFYFDAFDEGWKTGERNVGTHWGLYDQSGNLKPEFRRWLPTGNPTTIRERGYRDVFVGSKLEMPFDLGVNTDTKQRHWLTAQPGMLTLDYPARQQWGAMVITAGRQASRRKRSSIDLSGYKSISVELRAATDGQRVRLGIMDWTQPANGSEITFEEKLTTHWSTVTLPLSLFANVDLKHTYVALELVFHGSAAETMEMRNLRYSLDNVAAPELSPADMPFAVYDYFAGPGNHYVPSGSMGDHIAVRMTEDWTGDPHDGKTCIRVTYGGPVAGGVGWAGVYWQDPVDNWGTVPGPVGYDLRHATQLTFWVRGETGGERVQFLVGGIDGEYGDSLNPAVKTPVLRLSTNWRQVTIDLTGVDLTHIIGGFGWVATGQDNPGGATFYLDDIMYSA
jgi:exo-beta-1,3-glucanase (GH17 family)